ncbi:MAG: class I SAM-dependent methyltransferase [Allosphingosinicella sp.]
MSRRYRWLARQFSRPSGWLARLIIAPWLNRIGRAMNRLVLAELRVGADDDVLEVGFGGGGLLRMLLAVTAGRITGVDVSEDMVERARRQFRREPRVSLHAGSVEQLPLADASVDRACSVNNLYFWPDPEGGMRELARVIRPGGVLAIAFEPPEELRKWAGHRFGFRLFEPAEVGRLMGQAGFDRIREREGLGRRPDRFLCLTGERIGAEAQP